MTVATYDEIIKKEIIKQVFIIFCYNSNSCGNQTYLYEESEIPQTRRKSSDTPNSLKILYFANK